MPAKTVKHINGPTGILCGSEEDGAITTRAIIWSEGYICTKDGSGAAKKVFEVLPADAIRELNGMNKTGGVEDKDTYISYEELCARIPKWSVEGWMRRGCHLDHGFDVIVRGGRSRWRGVFGRRGPLGR